MLQEVAKQSKDELISKDKRYRALTEVAKRLRGELEESRPKLEMVPVLQDANARLKEDLDNVTAAYLKLLAERKVRFYLAHTFLIERRRCCCK